MPGPPPKPTALKLAAGNPGHRQLNRDEPLLRPHFRPPPPPRELKLRKNSKGKELMKEARRMWSRKARELHFAGLLPVVSTETLVRYCIAWEKYLDAMELVHEYGQVMATHNQNLVLSAYAVAANQQQEILHRIETEFGMTPASKSRIFVKPAGTNAPPTAAEQRKRRFFGNAG
jgi:P27 family predicted phage terminase small subunit